MVRGLRRKTFGELTLRAAANSTNWWRSLICGKGMNATRQISRRLGLAMGARTRSAAGYCINATVSMRFDPSKFRIYFILNDCLKKEINDSVHAICAHYSVPCIDLVAIAKQKGHPSIAGMKSIADQVTATVISLTRANR